MDVVFNKHAIGSHDLRFSSLISTSRSLNSAIIKPFRYAADYNLCFNAGKPEKSIKTIVNKLVMNMGSSANKKFLTRKGMKAFQKPGAELRDWECLPNPLIT